MCEPFGTSYTGWIELNGIWVRDLPGPMNLGLRTGPLCPIFHTKLEGPCSFSKVPDGSPYLVSWYPQGPKRRNLDMYVWVKPRPHTHKIWTEVSSSVPHFLQVELLLIPIIYRWLLKVLCPVSGPITTLDCVLFIIIIIIIIITIIIIIIIMFMKD